MRTFMTRQSRPEHQASFKPATRKAVAGSGPVAATGPGHDFGAVPVHARAPTTIQPKLAINAPRDPYEQEADRVAGEVMRMPDSGADGTAGVRRDPEATKPQRQCPECEGKGGSETEEIDGHVESEIRSLRGGSPLPETERAFFEPRFGHDFTAVRVHTDSRAARLAKSVNAHAFALGRDIVFGSGRYSPGTAEGRHLLAHELTHVVQQERVQPHIQRLTITQHSFH